MSFIVTIIFFIDKSKLFVNDNSSCNEKRGNYELTYKKKIPEWKQCTVTIEKTFAR